MVEFVTLLLGLISGVQAIEVSVTEEVARVELLLDGAVVATVDGEPWRAEVDLGRSLRPHVLEAVAWTANGKEVDRAEQILNTAQSRAVLRIILGRPRGDGTRDGRLVWLSADNRKPVRIAVTLDAEPLEVVARRAFELPFVELRSDDVHIISAQADFPDGQVATATVLLGGRFGDSVVSQLTAVPVVLAPGVELPAAEKMAGWLTKDDEPLEVMAVEERAAEVIVVRDRGSLAPLSGLGARFQEARHRAVGTLGPQRTVRLLKATPVQPPVPPEEDEDEDDDEAQAAPIELFPLSEPLSEGYGGVPWILGSKFFREFNPGDVQGDEIKLRRGKKIQPQRLADAVANAGVAASASGFMRAVVLVLGERPEDDSQWRPAIVRDYLRTLRVPLHVWSITSTARRADLGGLEGWEPVEDISNHPRYFEAIDALTADLGKQRILWVRGEHFVHDVRLASHVEGVTLAD
ncbi:MAG: hypothetical protein GY719_02650 [bacterium]|nr:hypothetical protein [bacterium]